MFYMTSQAQQVPTTRNMWETSAKNPQVLFSYILWSVQKPSLVYALAQCNVGLINQVFWIFCDLSRPLHR